MRSGYVGGTVLDLFLQHPKAKTFAIATPVRSPAKAKLLEQFGVKAPIASLDDHDKLESLASSADVVFNIVRYSLRPLEFGLTKLNRRARTTYPQLKQS